MICETPTPPAASKLLGLEVLRFVAAFSVLVWHYQHFAYVGGAPVGFTASEMPCYGLLWPFFEAGEYGVWVFWCISGFIFFWKYRDAIHDRRVGGWRFVVLRFSRLYPLHLVTLLSVAILQIAYTRMQGHAFVYQDNDWPHFLLQILLASGWGAEQGDTFNGPIWSISVEVLVYMLFFVMLRYVGKSALLNVLVIVLCFNLRGQVFSCLAFFYAGGLAAFARQAYAGSPRRIIMLLAAWSVVAAGVAFVAAQGLEMGVTDWPFFLGLTPILLFCISGPLVLPQRAERLVVAAGNMTYSSYLLHFPLQLALAVVFAAAGRVLPYDASWFFAIYLGATLLTSRLAFLFFEMPAQEWLRARLLPASRHSQIAQRLQPDPVFRR